MTIPKSTKAERIEENCKVRFSYAVKLVNIQTTVFNILVCLSVVLYHFNIRATQLKLASYSSLELPQYI